MTAFGLATGFGITLFVGAYTGINVKRPWTHLPWRIMYRQPEPFGGRPAVSRHILHLVCWSLGLGVYFVVGVTLASYGAVPAVARMYPSLQQSVPPRIGLASELVAAFGISVGGWLLSRRLVQARHKNVPSGLLGLEKDLPPRMNSLPRDVYNVLADRANLILRFLLFAIIPFYDHLWCRDGQILAGGATILLKEFPHHRFLHWHNRRNPENAINSQGVHLALMEALQQPGNGGYYGVHTVLMQLNELEDPDERRRYARTKVSPPLRVQLTIDAAPIDAKLVDYSPGGIAVLHPKPFELKQCVTLRVHAQRFTMEVVRCECAEAASSYIVGMRYQSELAGRTACPVINQRRASSQERGQA
jgi:hypothetical protein